jgi:hypothetical protein
MRDGRIDPQLLDLGTRWRWVVSFTSLSLYPQGKNPQSPLDRRLDGPQSRSGRFGENFWPYRDSNSDPSVLQPLASRYSNYAITANVSIFILNSNKFRDVWYIHRMIWIPQNSQLTTWCAEAACLHQVVLKYTTSRTDILLDGIRRYKQAPYHMYLQQSHSTEIKWNWSGSEVKTHMKGSWTVSKII